MTTLNNYIDISATVATMVKILGDVYIGKDVIHDFINIYPKVIIDDNVEIFEGAVIGRLPKGARLREKLSASRRLQN